MPKTGDILILALIVVSLLSAPSSVRANDVPKTPHRIIQELYRSLASHRPATPQAEAIEAARLSIRNYVRQGGDPKQLTEPLHGSSPLKAAAVFGFAEILEELLQYPSVAAGVNDVDEKGITPWMHVNFAWHQSAWLCHPSLFDDSMRMMPFVFIQAYYAGKDEAPYVRARRLLEAAGAVPAMQETKRVWQQQCPNQSVDTAKKIAESTDLLETLRNEGPANLNAVILARMKTQQSPQPQNPKR